jgi:hypothetical protein
MQREVASLPGPLVSMAGHGNRLLLALHAGHPLPGQQVPHQQILFVVRQIVFVADCQWSI